MMAWNLKSLGMQNKCCGSYQIEDRDLVGLVF